MILSDRGIRSYQRSRGLISPFEDSLVQPASVDLRLGPEAGYLGIIRGGTDWSTDSWDMLPGEFLLATTLETVNLPNHLVGQISGKSSLMRKGLQVCGDAGYIDPGFKGQVTLELKNLGYDILTLEPGMKICQIVFTAMSSAAEFPYGSPGLGSHYQNQEGVTKSALP